MQVEKYIADKITSLCEMCDISKYRLSQLSGISQSSLGRIMAQEEVLRIWNDLNTNEQETVMSMLHRL